MEFSKENKLLIDDILLPLADDGIKYTIIHAGIEKNNGLLFELRERLNIRHSANYYFVNFRIKDIDEVVDFFNSKRDIVDAYNVKMFLIYEISTPCLIFCNICDVNSITKKQVNIIIDDILGRKPIERKILSIGNKILNLFKYLRI